MELETLYVVSVADLTTEIASFQARNPGSPRLASRRALSAHRSSVSSDRELSAAIAEGRAFAYTLPGCQARSTLPGLPARELTAEQELSLRFMGLKAQDTTARESVFLITRGDGLHVARGTEGSSFHSTTIPLPEPLQRPETLPPPHVPGERPQVGWLVAEAEKIRRDIDSSDALRTLLAGPERLEIVPSRPVAMLVTDTLEIDESTETTTHPSTFWEAALHFAEHDVAGQPSRETAEALTLYQLALASWSVDVHVNGVALQRGVALAGREGLGPWSVEPVSSCSREN